MVKLKYYGFSSLMSFSHIEFSCKTFESSKPAYFPSDYIEKKQKVGVDYINYLVDSINFLFQTPALFKTNNGDLTSRFLMLVNYVILVVTYTYEMYVRGNIELNQEVNYYFF